MFDEYQSNLMFPTIPQQFEAIARRHPERLAVKMGDAAMSYGDLNRRANNIARAVLQERGFGSESVALLFDQSTDVVAACLGVLKAGKFYVVIDPSTPADRLAWIIDDIETRLILTNRHSEEIARKHFKRAPGLLNIDEGGPFSTGDDFSVPILPESLVTIHYTSGSTGMPKGVMKTHANVILSVQYGKQRIGTKIDDRFTLLHYIGFGAAEFNLFQALLNGASLFPFDLKTDGIPALARMLADENITVYHSTPTVFREMANSIIDQKPLPHLRMLHLSGAPITRKDFDLYLSRFGAGTLLEIGMGSTEARGICSAIVDHSFSFPPEGNPVGFPVRGKKILLLDETGGEVGPGEIGEIAVKGQNLSPGYWKQPHSKNAKFLPDPDGGDERIYLTGDLGKMLPDGFLIHVGRKDLQIKIRGYRVELGEIEKALLAHHQVKEAGVVAWDWEDGEKQLAAYVVSGKSPPPTANELRDFLSGTLPVYMLPSTFMFLESLPLTNGKLDRTALPLPDHKRPNLEQPYAPPHSDVEKRLVQIWQEVLNVQPIGIHDNFFDLGGHSLLAAKLFVCLDDEFGRLLPLSVLFAAPTVHLLAEHYRSSMQPQKISPLVPLMPAGSLPAIYAVPGVFGNVVGFVDLSRELGAQQPFYGLQSIGLDGAQAPLDTVEEMAKLYLSEIRAIQSHGPYALIGACFGSRVAYEMTRQLHDADEEVAFLGLLDPIGLERDEKIENLLSVPPIIHRAKVLGSFVTDRLRLYLEELRGLKDGNHIQFIAKKIRSLSLKIGDRRAIRGVRREFHQLEVFKASKLAGKRYYRKPLKGHLRTLEIFESAHPHNNKEWVVDWKSFWNGSAVRHHLRGRDSGDMLNGKNARVLAALLAERLRAAFARESTKLDSEKVLESSRCGKRESFE